MQGEEGRRCSSLRSPVGSGQESAAIKQEPFSHGAVSDRASEQLHPGVSKRHSKKRDDATKDGAAIWQLLHPFVRGQFERHVSLPPSPRVWGKFSTSWGRIPTWAPMIMALFRERAMGQNPNRPPMTIPIPTKTGSTMGGEFTYQPTWDPKTVLTQQPEEPFTASLLAPRYDPCARSKGAHTRKGGAMPRAMANRAMAGLRASYVRVGQTACVTWHWGKYHRETGGGGVEF